MESQEEDAYSLRMDKHFVAPEILNFYGSNNDASSKRKRKCSETETDTDAKRVTDFVPSVTYAKNLATSVFGDTPNEDAKKRNRILISVGETVASWKRIIDYDVEVEQSDEPHVPSNVRYMYEILSKQGRILTYVCRNLGEKLCKVWFTTHGGNDVAESYVKDVRNVSQTYFRTFGRIREKEGCTSTMMLEGCTRRKGASAAESIELDFRNMKQYSVFSGQIVAVEATNPVGDKLYVREIFTKAYAPPAPVPRIRSRINVFVAAGPFTVSSNLHYQSLWDLMEMVAADEPHILILIGPFLEFAHPGLDKLKETHQAVFERILTRIMELTSKSTQVVLVTSNRDVHQEPVFPTPRYTVFDQKLLHAYSNLKLMPDPCILDIEGLKIGITSVDVLKHIGRKELTNISGMDRLGRLADHLLAQTCFYPVYPAFEELNVDTEMWERYTFFDQQPHLLILPSDMQSYCKVINNCVTLNPGRMHKSTYARLSIVPSISGLWKSEDNISCDITKVE